jgi:hypothetical protein
MPRRLLLTGNFMQLSELSSMSVRIGALRNCAVF